jgi:hypothetical protein
VTLLIFTTSRLESLKPAKGSASGYGTDSHLNKILADNKTQLVKLVAQVGKEFLASTVIPLFLGRVALNIYLFCMLVPPTGMRQLPVILSAMHLSTWQLCDSIILILLV